MAEIQALLFNVQQYDIVKANKYLEKHKLKSIKIEKTVEHYKFILLDKDFESYNVYNVKDGILAVVGYNCF